MERVLTLLKSGGLFYFFSQIHSKKTIQMKSSKNIFFKKIDLFPVLGGKIFFLWRACVWMDAMDCCEAFRACVPGRVWMDAMEVVHV